MSRHPYDELNRLYFNIVGKYITDGIGYDCDPRTVPFYKLVRKMNAYKNAKHYLERLRHQYAVTTTASPDSETTLEVEKNVTDGDERSSDD